MYSRLAYGHAAVHFAVDPSEGQEMQKLLAIADIKKDSDTVQQHIIQLQLFVLDSPLPTTNHQLCLLGGDFPLQPLTLRVLGASHTHLKANRDIEVTCSSSCPLVVSCLCVRTTDLRKKGSSGSPARRRTRSSV